VTHVSRIFFSSNMHHRLFQKDANPQINDMAVKAP